MYNILRCLSGALLLVSTSCSREGSEQYLFVGTYAKASDAGIYLYRFNTEDGSATLVQAVSGIENPSYLALDK